jgi:FtsH-binding integral membrane protein
MFIGIFRYDPNFSILYDLYCCLGAIAFGIFLIIDIQLISGGHRYELSLDDYVTGALILYIDIIQILLFLLRIMGKKRR